MDDVCSGGLDKKVIPPISRGILYELNTYRRANNHTWNDFYGWVPLPSLGLIKVAVSRLEKKCSELSQNKHPDQIQALFHEPFVMCS